MRSSSSSSAARPTRYDELKRRADAQEPLPSFRLDGVRLTFNLDAEYEIVRTQLTHNVAAIVEGSDPQLKNTYVAFGAHYDHLGYAEGEVTTAVARRGVSARPSSGSSGRAPKTIASGTAPTMTGRGRWR